MRSFRARQGALLPSKGAFWLPKGTFLGAQSSLKKVRFGCVLGAFLGGCIYPHTPMPSAPLGSPRRI
jgi:hypothetical protein